MSFLQQTAGYLYRTLGNGLSDCCVVFPNKRAGLFFSKALGELIEKPLFSPEYKTISDLMQELSGYRQADTLYMLVLLHRIYCKCTGREERFDLFYPWGEMLLADFDDIDKNLVNAADLFQNLSQLKEIDAQFHYLTPEQTEAVGLFWNRFSDGTEGPVKKDFLQLWSQLYPIYLAFREELRRSGRGYTGMMYRECAENPEKSVAERPPFDTYIFVGFNVLNAAEKALFRWLKSRDKALFFWDYDNYYIDNLWHEAGYFMRTNLQEFPMPAHFIADHNAFRHPPSIRIVATPSTVGQAIMVSELLAAQVTTGDQLQQTAIILPDEQLLFPLLDYLPHPVAHANITMGYPFTSTPAYSLFVLLCSLQQNIRIVDHKICYFYKDLQAILQHPWLRRHQAIQSEALDAFMKKHNRVWVTREELLNLINEEESSSVYAIILQHCPQLSAWTGLLTACAEWLLNRLDPTSENASPEKRENVPPGFDREFIYLFYTALKRALSGFSELGVEMESATFNKMFRKHLETLRIPFQGEPLKGLQILGVLETRVLSFAHILICSMNEGFWPKTTTAPSYIPYNLRRGFGLMTPEHQDAMYAYYFYRLLQGAKEVTLLYNPEAGELQGGEMSRYINQLRYEAPFTPTFQTLHFTLQPTRKPITEMVRTPEIQAMLLQKYSSPESRSYLSPSSITMWMQCRLKFGLRYVEQLREPEKVLEEMNEAMFGTLLHKSMQTLYAPWVGSEVGSELTESVLRQPDLIRQHIDEAFASELFHQPLTSAKEWISGRNLLIREVLFTAISKILEVDGKRAPFTLFALEKELSETRPVPGIAAGVRVGGKIDRIDRFDGSLRVIDYKSGKVESQAASVEELFSGKKERAPLFQILLYAGMLARSEPAFSIRAGLYGLRNLFDKNFDERIFVNKESIESYSRIGLAFDELLTQITGEIFDTENHFVQTENRTHCQYCPYNKICHRN